LPGGEHLRLFQAKRRSSTRRTGSESRATDRGGPRPEVASSWWRGGQEVTRPGDHWGWDRAFNHPHLVNQGTRRWTGRQLLPEGSTDVVAQHRSRRVFIFLCFQCLFLLIVSILQFGVSTRNDISRQAHHDRALLTGRVWQSKGEFRSKMRRSAPHRQRLGPSSQTPARVQKATSTEDNFFSARKCRSRR